MVKRSFLRLGACGFLLLTVLLAGSAVAAEKDLVVDLADVLSDTDEAALQASAAELGEQYAMDVVIVTADDIGGKTDEAYADDYFDYNGYGVGSNRDGLLLLIDFQNRRLWISTSGAAIGKFSDDAIDTVLDNVYYGGMEDGDYYGAARTFLNNVGNVLRGNVLTAVDILVALLAGGGLAAGVYGGVRGKYKGKNTRPVFAVEQNSLVSFGQVTDNLFNTYVTSRVIPRNTSAGGRGGSSTHTSSSGRTHGGGGRGF